VFCQLAYLRCCIPGRIRRALGDLPETLDETYERALKEIDMQNREYAHRLFQCVAAASRPLRVEELAEFLALDFKAGSIPRFLADWRPEDPTHTVLSTCSSLLAIVDDEYGFQVIQFAHFSVKEYLTSERLAETKETISRFHVSMTPAHTIIAQACLGVLLNLDKSITKDSLRDFPLAEYAAKHWVEHARFKNVSSGVQDGMKCLFDPSKSHLRVWVWIFDPDSPWTRPWHPKSPPEARATPLHYATFCGMPDVATFLIVELSQEVNARGFDNNETSLHTTSRRGDVELAQVLLEHGAEIQARDRRGRTPILLASQSRHVELAQVLLEHGAETEARDIDGRTPILIASDKGHVVLVQLLLKHGAETEARDNDGCTLILLASDHGHVELVQLLLKHGAEIEARDNYGRTPLHLALNNRRMELVQLLLKQGADTEARDDEEFNPFERAVFNGQVEVARILLEHDADANAQVKQGYTSNVFGIGMGTASSC
jgi:ankyrin repeat protein